jgi:hypothetical protein
VERVKRFKFLGVHITDDLKWSLHTDSVVKKAQRHLFNLRRHPKTLTNSTTIENILLSCITAWYGKCTFLNCRALHRDEPALQDIWSSQYSTQCHRKAKKIMENLSHLSHGLFTPQPCRRRRQ